MVQFLVKRLVGLVFVILCVTFITFIFGYYAPGDPIRALLGQHQDPVLYAQLKHAYGLDLPWYQQYWNFLSGLFRLDFGYSFHTQGKPVSEIILQGIPASTELGIWALALTLLLGIPLGIVSALKANSWLDTLIMGGSLIFWALPSFILAIFVQVIVVWLDKVTGYPWPVANWGTVWSYSWDDIQYKLVPIIVFAALGFAFYARLTRTTMLEVLRQDYVRTARAKGLRERIVIYRHAFRNALIPLMTVLGLAIGTIIAGAFFIEQIFNIPGIGATGLTAVTDRDYPVIQATTVLFATCVVFGNLLSDIFYTLVDPRIKAE
ncbi:ABC transporter permease [Ktedonospora formicarum]|uniref:Peptide ABC transporter permease n=1 Tax=Ktedonospora formicarum TaxID=2778364 RepID=A0A8J3I3S2_9CHLR|nr:ABC transporter permease [Ktedonospora formicarum]GHO45453.1 peptide ABC transporter permease [Ktedonospora formicarum]